MTDFLIESIGFAAGCCTTLALAPQVLHTWRSRSARDISLSMCLLMVIGVGLWAVYGFFIASVPVVLFNLLSFVLALAVLVMQLRFDGPGSK